ncbi:putative asparaginase [Halotydeus destructor]|nr:putative asparaginase [Halotydeus destructor]
MDGPTHDAGSVGGIRRVKSAISVARKVLEHTRVTLLVAEQATDFAKSMGFPVESLTSNQSATEHRDWLKNGCQPNYWVKVKPDPSRFCGPYQSADSVSVQRHRDISDKNHDTIGMVVIDRKGWMAVGTSTNGLDHKIAGRVGDSPIIGSGAYVDQQHGAAAATGDGDVMMRFLPSYQAVESLRQGMTPDQAAKDAMRRIAARAPDFQGAIVVATSDGHYSAACHGLGSFPYSVANDQTGKAVVKTVPCISTY